MGSIQKAANRYRIGIWWQGKKVWISQYLDGKPLDTREIAERAKTRIETEVDEGTFRVEHWTRKLYIWERAVDDWRNDNPASSAWEANRDGIIRIYIDPYFQGRDIKKIDSVHVRDWWATIKGLDLSFGYKRLIQRVLKSILRYHSDILSMPKFPRPKGRQVQQEKIESEDLDKILACIPARHKAVFTFIHLTGCRLSEACKLRKADIDRTKGQIVFKQTKTGKDRRFPLIPELQDALKTRDLRSPYVFTRADNKPYTRWAIWHIWDIANAKAGVPHYRPYVMRSAFACAMSGKMDSGMLSKLLGHDVRTLLRHYLEYDLETLRKAILGERKAEEK